MAGRAEMRLQYPATARDASVLLLEQILTAANLKHIVAAPGKEDAFEKWKSLAAVTLSDAALRKTLRNRP